MVAEMIEAPAPTNAEVAQMAQRVVMARQMAAQAKEAAKAAEDDFIAISKAATIETVELIDGTLVTRVDADRRRIDAKKLADIATKATFDSVTEPKVNHKKFDAAIELGTIGKRLVREVVTTTPYSAIRVTKA